MKHSRKKLPIHGFSLIELIPIIAVIGILVVFNYSSIKSLYYFREQQSLWVLKEVLQNYNHCHKYFA